MPYDNEYNRMVADDIMTLNRKYVEHDKKMGEGLSGGFLGALAGMVLPSVISGISKSIFGGGMSAGGMSGAGEEMEAATYDYGDASKTGGAKMSGYASGTFRDTGFDKVIGAGMSAGVKVYKRRGRPRKTGGAKLGLPSSIVGGALIPKENLPSSSMSGGAMSIGCGRSGAGRSGAGRSGAGRSGGGLMGDFKKMGDLLNDEKFIEKVKKARKERTGKGRSGAGVSGGGLMDMLKPRGRMGNIASVIKDAGKILQDKDLIDKMKKQSGRGRSGAGKSGAGVSGAGGVSGGGRKERAELVKKIMREKGMSMIEASKYVKANNLYTKK